MKIELIHFIIIGFILGLAGLTLAIISLVAQHMYGDMMSDLSHPLNPLNPMSPASPLNPLRSELDNENGTTDDNKNADDRPLTLTWPKCFLWVFC